jgi:hypothetical protein
MKLIINRFIIKGKSGQRLPSNRVIVICLTYKNIHGSPHTIWIDASHHIASSAVQTSDNPNLGVPDGLLGSREEGRNQFEGKTTAFLSQDLRSDQFALRVCPR